MTSSGFVLLVLAVSLCSEGDSRLIFDPFSLIRQKSLTLDICPECSQIIQLSTNMISGSNAKETVYEALHALCQRLPGEEALECSSQVKTFLPKILQQTPGHLKPRETCEVLGLCISHKNEGLPKLQHHVFDKATYSPASGTEIKPKEPLNPVCTLCLFFIKKLETLLPKNMTEDTLMKVMGEVCDLMPSSYKDQCDDFVDKYGVAIVEFLLSSAAPHTICSLLHLCLFQDQPLPDTSVPSDCESCRTLAVLSRLHLGLNASESQTAAFLQSVCALHPHAVPKCEAFIRIYGSQLQKFLGDQMEAPHVCERADLCIATKRVELLGRNRCTWGPSYWCKDSETAQECDNQAFCEKFMWKKEE